MSPWPRVVLQALLQGVQGMLGGIAAGPGAQGQQGQQHRQVGQRVEQEAHRLPRPGDDESRQGRAEEA